MKQLPGQIAFPEDNEVERLFRLVPGLNRWDMTDVMPFHNYPSVREARGLLGESFFSGFQKVLTREYWHEPRQVLEIAVYFSLLSEGNAGAVHGGAIAATFDHSFGRCLLRSIGFGSNATLNLGIDYKKFVPIDTVVRISCEPAVRDGRKVTLVGHLTNADGSVEYARAKALFYDFTGRHIKYHDGVAYYGPMTLEQYTRAVTNKSTAAERVLPKQNTKPPASATSPSPSVSSKL